MYIGNTPALSYTSFAKQDFSTSATTSYTLDHPVTNANELALFINFVRQEPTTAYSASNTTLTFTSATSASDDMYCVFLGKAVQTVNPPNASVGNSQVEASMITGQTALAATPDDTDELLISDAGTLKRIDYSYIKPTNAASFCAVETSGQTGLSSGSTTKLTFNSEDFDTDSAFDLSNNKFVAPSAGKYFFGIQVVLQATLGSGYFSHGSAFLYKNGSNFASMGRADDRSDNNSREWSMDGSIIVDAAANDYFEVYAVVYTDSGTWLVNHGDKGHRFFGYKLIT